MSNPMRRKSRNKTVTAPQKGPLQRIEDLETGLRMMMEVATKQQATIERLEHLQEAVEALLGPQEVHGAMAAISAKRASEGLALAIAEGRMIPDQIMQPGYLITANLYPKLTPESVPEGLSPAPFQTWFEALLPEIKAAFLGKGEGERYTLPDGQSIVVEKIYRPVEPSPVAEPPAPPAQEAAPAEAAQ